MILKLYDPQQMCTLVEKEYSTDFFDTSFEPVKEKTTVIDTLYGCGTYKEVYFDGIHIGFSDMIFPKSFRLGFESNFETIEMHFCLKGNNSAYSTGYDKNINFQGFVHNIIYAKNISGEMHWDKNSFMQCEINLTPTFLKKFIPPSIPLFDAFRNAVEKGNTQLLSTDNHLITSQMYDVLTQILQCKRVGVFKKMFLESKVIELLLLQLEQFCADIPHTDSLNRRDRDKIYAVREYIIKNIDSSHSLIDLAHEVGTNDFILKKGFKELFGTTVFSFWAEEKMKYAIELLEEQNLNINEISDRIGYKNQRHFSTAFKKRYGVPPSQWCK